MKPPKSRKAELGPNATGGENSHAETAYPPAGGCPRSGCPSRGESAEFKMTELGPIPKDWEVKRLGEIWSSFKTGPFGSSLHAQDYVENGTPLINPMHIQDGKIEPSPDMTVDDATKQRLSAYKLSQDDIIIGRRGEMGRAALVGEKENGWLCGTGCFFLHLKESCCPSYIALYLRTPTSVASLNGEAVGTTLVNLNQKILSDLKIPLPPLAEQRRIAGALSDVDELISALGKLIEKKRNIKTGAMQQLLTGKTRLPGFKGKWVEKTFCEFISRFATGLNPRQNFKLNSGGNNYYITIKDFKNGKISFNGCDKVDDLALRLINERSDLRAGDLLFSSIGRVGDAYVIKDTPSNWNINESVFSLRPDESQMDVNFLYYLVKSSAVQERLTSGITGSTLTGIKIGELRGIVCFYPNELAEQKAIAAVLSDMDAEIAALEADRGKYERIKSGMMQELLTGKTRLEA